MEYAKTDLLTFTLDIKQAIRSGYSPFDYLSGMQQSLVNIHACDYLMNGEVALKMPGQGVFDFYALRDKLKETQYTGPIIIEVYSDLYRDLSELKYSYDFLKKVAACVSS